MEEDLARGTEEDGFGKGVSPSEMKFFCNSVTEMEHFGAYLKWYLRWYLLF